LRKGKSFFGKGKSFFIIKLYVFGLIRPGTCFQFGDFTTWIRTGMLPADPATWGRVATDPECWGRVADLVNLGTCYGSGLRVELLQWIRESYQHRERDAEKNHYIEGIRFCIKKYKKVLTVGNRRNIMRSQQRNSNPSKGEKVKER